MKKISLWGVGALVALGFAAYLLSSQVSLAENGINGTANFDKTNFSVPGDGMWDELSDRPGHDQTNDRTPDNTVDQVNDGTPDCAANVSGGGGGRGKEGNGCEANLENHADAGDATPEDQFGDGCEHEGACGSTFADGRSINDGIPDASRIMPLNRAIERGGNHGSGNFATRDYTPDWIYSDTYLARIGGPNSVGDGDGAGSASDGGRPVFGRGVNSPTMRPHDSVSDGDPDSLNYSFGPGDKKEDASPDMGGLGTIAGGGSSGCSLVAGSSATPASGLAYLLVLLTPAALVVIRRKLRRK